MCVSSELGSIETVGIGEIFAATRRKPQWVCTSCRGIPRECNGTAQSPCTIPKDGFTSEEWGWLMAAAHFFDLINNSTGEIHIAAKNEPQPKD